MTDQAVTDTPHPSKKPRCFSSFLRILCGVVFVRFVLSPNDFSVGDLGNQWINERRVLHLQVSNSSLGLAISYGAHGNSSVPVPPVVQTTNPPTPTQPRPFQGTKITPISEGMDLLENVCLVKGSRRQTNQLISFGPKAEQMTTSVHKYKRPGWSIFTAVTVGHNLSEWETKTQQYPLIRNETLFTLEIWANPGHCLNDLVYSIALDATQRQLHPDGNSPIYPNYLLSYFKGIGGGHGENNADPAWCHSFLRDAGFIDTQRGPVYDDAPGLCFERLLMPLIAVHRFPIDWKNPEARADVAASHGVDLGMKEYTGEGTMYPVEALAKLHERVMHFRNFTTTPWDDQPSGEEDVPVLLYTREGNPRRHWTNADEVKIALERDYRVRVHTVGADWKTLSPPEQAQLYHNFSRIIAVHGAHLANLFYCRNNTRIVELKCGRANPEAKLSLEEEPPANSTEPSSDWYGQRGWFTSATRRVGLEHFVFAEHSVPHQSVNSFNATTSLLVPFLASRLHLVPRGNRDPWQTTLS
ncbi:expressed unknown protein [Seminavis robusta]|uniref:Glycosyltransferase 61 catalytic domain-containing protein n=1 Tax=Seminavis robusta TaxID=568900 RepID=A0A9N8HLV6_9STRA|nr:expressed unknown protein [Seminavis robusta]|eukprot:Sro846_g210110.1 n/a (526) ;mRNA; r:5520-7097